MGVKLIVGPPNSGRTGKILVAFKTAAERDPVLVVPTVDDVERFEKELTRDGAVVIGATVGTFDQLFALVARAMDAPAGPAVSRTQRLRLAREAASRSHLRILAPSSRRPGFPAALEELVSELQAALVDSNALRERATEAGRYEQEIASLYESYLSVRGELGLHDDHSLAAAATTALRERPDGWGARPVFLYGFDDLTHEQLELVRELSAITDVTVALPWEDRESLTLARGALFAELRDFGGVTIERLDAEPRFTRSSTLFDVERRFGERDGAEPIENDGGVALLASAGELAEVEAVGGEVARLLDEGVPAGEIAIVLRDPRSAGPLYRRVLSRYGIPVAVQADLAATRTATGAGLIALLRAAVDGGGAPELLAYLRTPGVAPPSMVDWFERRLLRGRLRTTDEALEAWRPDAEDGHRGLREVTKLREAGSGAALLREAGKQARWIAEAAVRRRGVVTEEDRALELRAGAEIEQALTELAALGLPHSPQEVIAAVTELDVPMWRGPTEGRVRVISPYRARARRVAHMFVCSMQDGDFPRRDTGGPLLSDDDRRALGLPERKKAEVEDRYLFSVCLSRPKERLWLSWRSADDEGGATSRSPYVDEVRELLAPKLPEELEERDEAIVAEAGGRGLAESVFDPDSAPSDRELARARAATGPRTENGRLRPGPLRLEPVLERMREIRLFGPSTLEEYALCPYRWFVGHELRPQRIGPVDEPLISGSIAHQVLESLYEEPPGPEPRPIRESLDAWHRRARELIAEIGAERLPPEIADTAAALRRVEGIVMAFLTDEAATATPFVPAHTEAAFGFDESEQGPLQLAGGGVHGQIDRIDLGPHGEALVQDYKSGGKVEGGAAMLEKRGKLQLQLYMLAARELWGHDLAGGLYRPLGGTGDRKPKGLLRKELAEDLAGLDPRPKDHLDDEAFDTALDEAREKAEEIIASIHSGKVIRDPLGGSCPDWCSFQPICRRERGLPEEEPWSEEGEEE
ncbi:MAG TPA: PD-(D/E)XK nuclease family protein [Solirubrobacterales bacterium]|nr:PD-(D/E)XK nuclease family protein [Solirubrobacterales bacterium]